MNINFTAKQEEYISTQVQQGDYQDASEVVSDALKLHALYRQRIIDELKVEIAKGWDGPLSSRSVQDIVAAKRNQ